MAVHHDPCLEARWEAWAVARPNEFPKPAWFLESYAVRFSRLPSYQRCSFARDRAVLRPPRITPKRFQRICLAEYIRNFRPDVRTGPVRTLKGPIFLRARLNQTSSATKY